MLDTNYILLKNETIIYIPIKYLELASYLTARILYMTLTGNHIWFII